MSLRLVMWAWRDGSIHPEMCLATIARVVDGEVVIDTHLAGENLVTYCGIGYFGRASSVGYMNPAKIDCPNCRDAIRGKEVMLDV